MQPDQLKKIAKALMALVFAIPPLSCAAQNTASQAKNSASSVMLNTMEKTQYPWDQKKSEGSSGYVDFEFAWDEFKHRTTMTWACRGVQTGKTVDNAFCESREQNDAYWPGKEMPPDWSPPSVRQK